MSYCLVSCPMKFYVFSPILSISIQLLWDTSAPIFPTYLRSPVNCTRFHLWQSNMNHTYRLPNIHICMHAFRRNMCAADTLQIVMIARSNCRSRWIVMARCIQSMVMHVLMCVFVWEGSIGAHIVLITALSYWLFHYMHQLYSKGQDTVQNTGFIGECSHSQNLLEKCLCFFCKPFLIFWGDVSPVAQPTLLFF